MSSDYVLLTEGRARFWAPNLEKYRRPDGAIEPSWAPVFYNPRMAFNRDVAVLFVHTFFKGLSGVRVAEPLAGTGVRGIRIALETSGVSELVLNDADPEAYSLVERNIALNGLAGLAEAYRADANALLYRLKDEGRAYHYIDLDPFGSPIYYVDAALRALRKGGVLAVTATDTAPLVGTHGAACVRRYGARPLRSDFAKEAGLRILVGAVVRRAAMRELAATPVLAYYADHYYRAYFVVLRGARRTDEALSLLGYYAYCDTCLYREAVEGYPAPQQAPERCPNCGSPLALGGPMWIGRLCDEDLVSRMLASIEEMEHLEAKARVRTLLEKLRVECSVTRPYVRIDELCGRMRINMPSPRLVAALLEAAGYRAAVTHFDPRAVKTDAPLEEVRSLVEKHARGREAS